MDTKTGGSSSSKRILDFPYRPIVKTEESPTTELQALQQAPRPFEFVYENSSSPAEEKRKKTMIRSRAAMKMYNKERRSRLRNRQEKPTEPTELWRMLTTSRRDPFRTFPTDFTLSHADFLLDFSTTTSWPRLLHTQGTPHTKVWLERAQDNPLAMHVVLFAALSRYISLCSNVDAVDVSRQLYHQTEMLRLINEELQQPVVKRIDEVINSVLALSTISPEPQDSFHRLPFDPPFADAQWISVYGSVVYIKKHMAGLVLLVEKRGGLDNIEWPGLAGVVSYADIIGATQELRHPNFPIPTSSLPPRSPIQPSTSILKTSYLGSAFLSDLSPSTGPFNFPKALFLPLSSLVSYTLLLESWDRGLVAKPSAFELSSRRNAMQHALLSLPAAAELTYVDGAEAEASVDLHLYESLRLGALLFSLAVVFPMPVTVGMIRNVIRQLRYAILAVQYSKDGNGWVGKEGMCLWLGVLAGIAAKWVPEERLLFVDIVRELLVVLRLQSWDDVTGVLDGYLWMERACDKGGREFWSEVVGKIKVAPNE